jgi:CubicO group peptidase (beta-lactamase class C family)
MTKRSSQVAIFFVALCFAASSIAQTVPGTDKNDAIASPEALRLIDVWLDSVQAYSRIPALSAAVVQGDKVVWAKGYGTLDAAHKIPATAQTIYSICSISKLFTSIALMQQWEAGRVRLDEPVTTYLPWATLKALEQDGLPMTLRAMLTHSAGLPRESDFPYWSGPDFPFPTHDEIKAKLPGQTPLWPASRWYQYSNLGLTLVGETVAAVSGESYAAYSQTHILDPLGLQDTRPFMPMPLYGKRLAVGWGAIERDGTRELVKPFDTRGVTPAAGYTSTVEDLGRFAIWQFRLLRSEHQEVLKASTLREMQRVQFTDTDWKTTRGLGFAVARDSDQTYVGHGGDCPGYHSVLSLRPATETAITAMLTGAEHPGAYAAAMFQLLDKRKAWAFKPPAPAKDVNLESYAGRYSAQPWNAETMIVPWAEGLAVLSLPSSNPARDLMMLKAKGGDIFRHVRDDGSEADEVRFERDKSGNVVRFIQFSNAQTRVAALSLPAH